jgi:hypothetical protein
MSVLPILGKGVRDVVSNNIRMMVQLPSSNNTYPIRREHEKNNIAAF